MFSPYPHFHNINKVKPLLLINNSVKYAAWTLFFILQGRAIEQAIARSYFSMEQLCTTLVLFLMVKLLVMLCDIVSKHIVSYYQNEALKDLWQSTFPLKIHSDTEAKSSLSYLLFFDYLPNLYTTECCIINNVALIISVFTIVLSLLVYSHFYLGFAALAITFILNLINRSIYREKLDNCYKNTYKNKTEVTHWLNQYFQAYREISINWQNDTMANWSKSVYKEFYNTNKRTLKFQLLRDVIAQFLVEVPFLLNTAMVIIGVYWDYLSISQMFVWVGIAQFVISASNAYLENRINRDQKHTLIIKIQEIYDCFCNNSGTLKISMSSATLDPQTRKTNEPVHITMLDGTRNQLGYKPGIYPIKGRNGSGKSTLLNIILQYERLIHNDQYEQIAGYFSKDLTNTVRIIERNAVIFSALQDFDHQIFGPNFPYKKNSIKQIDTTLKSLLLPMTGYKLIKIFKALKEKYYTRSEQQFSSGEKVLLSLMRMLAHWSDNVKLIIVDECTAFLDQDIKRSFMECLEQLSRHVAVYICTHEENLLKPVAAIEGFVEAKTLGFIKNKPALLL